MVVSFLKILCNFAQGNQRPSIALSLHCSVTDSGSINLFAFFFFQEHTLRQIEPGSINGYWKLIGGTFLLEYKRVNVKF